MPTRLRDSWPLAARRAPRVRRACIRMRAVVVPTAVMHEQMHHRTCSQQQPRKRPQDMGRVFSYKKERCDRQKSDAHHACLGTPEARCLGVGHDSPPTQEAMAHRRRTAKKL